MMNQSNLTEGGPLFSSPESERPSEGGGREAGRERGRRVVERRIPGKEIVWMSNRSFSLLRCEISTQRRLKADFWSII